ncbi:replication factor C large subunit [Methanococcus aeolicus]|uniref:replication factor C large subunit n=1 Tax=Methanococcus aeolicus TaxID=42879 RepID=UPI0021C5EBB4|nr:replication factor C large subunit [Methanococcus aeolicus]UXM84935.1 replication factor C large subunit [Methanococcus aeolicus]
MNTNWVEKYRPKTMSEIVGNNKIKEELKNWIEEVLHNEIPKPVLLVGPPGCGKTTLTNALANDYGFELIELNASDKRNKDIIRQIVGGASSSKSITGKRVLIVLDEVDGLSGNSDRGGVSEIIKIIKNAKNPIILTANDIYKPSLMSLRTVCNIVKIGSVHTNSIVPVLRRISLKEGFEVDDKILKIIAKHAGGDVRSAINDLESLAMGNTFDEDNVRELPDRDTDKSIFDAIRIIFKTTHYDISLEATRDLKEDIGTVQEWIAENVPREYKKGKEICLAYDNLSKADIFLGRVYKRQYYGLWRYASALMSAGVSLAKDEKYRGFFSYMRPTIFTKMSRSKGKRGAVNKVLEKISLKSHVSKRRAREDILYLEYILKNDAEMGAKLCEFYEFTKEDIEYLTNKTIAKKIIKLMKGDDKKTNNKKGKENKTKNTTKKIKEIKETPKKEEVKEPKKQIEKQKSEKKEPKKQMTLESFF